MSTAPHADRDALAGLIAGAVCIGFAPIFVRLVVLAGIVLCRLAMLRG